MEGKQMTNEYFDQPDHQKQSFNNPLGQSLIGRLMVSPINGKIMVTCPGFEPRPARFLSNVNRHELLQGSSQDREVLVVFAHGNPDEPVIVGMIENELEELVCMKDGPLETLIDGERVVLRANEEIVLTCGKGSITINKSGKIVVKGTDIVSRASQMNKMFGSGIEFN